MNTSAPQRAAAAPAPHTHAASPAALLDAEPVVPGEYAHEAMGSGPRREQAPYTSPHPAPHPEAHPASVLLVEADYMLRRTVALTARGLEYCEIHEATSGEAAERLLDYLSFTGLIIELADPRAMELISRVRGGITHCAADTPIAVLADELDAGRVAALRELNIARVIVKPARVRTLLEALNAVTRPAHAHAAHAAAHPFATV